MNPPKSRLSSIIAASTASVLGIHGVAVAQTVIAPGATQTIGFGGAATNVVFGNGVYQAYPAATLNLAGSGYTYTGSWGWNNGAARIELRDVGASITYAPTVAGTAVGTNGVDFAGNTGTTLTLASGSYTTGLFGVDSSLGIFGTTVVVRDARWVNELNANAVDGAFVLRHCRLDLDVAAATGISGRNFLSVSGSSEIRTLDAGTFTVSGRVFGNGNTLVLGGTAGSGGVVLNAAAGGNSLGNLTLNSGIQLTLGNTLPVSNADITANLGTIKFGQNLTFSSAARSMSVDHLILAATAPGKAWNWAGKLVSQQSSALLSVEDGAIARFNGDLSGYKGILDVTANSVFEFTSAFSPKIVGLTDATLRYVGSSDQTFSAPIDIDGTCTLSTAGGAAGGRLTLGGAISEFGGAANLKLNGPNPIWLAFASGNYGGKLILDGASAAVLTAGSVGAQGIDVTGNSSLSLLGGLSFGAGQALTMGANLSLATSTTGATATWLGDITGAVGNDLTISGMTLDFRGNGAAYFGTTTLGSGGQLLLSSNIVGGEVKLSRGTSVLRGTGTVGSLTAPTGFINPSAAAGPGTIDVSGNASLSGSILLSLLYPDRAPLDNADELAVAGVITGSSGLNAVLGYDPTRTGGALVPAQGQTVRYRFMTGGGLVPGKTVGTGTLGTWDPTTGQEHWFDLNVSGSTQFASGAKIEFDYSVPGEVAAVITGIINPTLVTVPGGTTPNNGTTNTNIGTVTNAQLVNTIQQVQQVTLAPAQKTDAQYVGSALLLLPSALLPGAVVTASVPANPVALPHTQFNSMSQAARVAKLRLMELHGGALGNAAARAAGQDTFLSPTSISGEEEWLPRSNARGGAPQDASTVVSQQLAVDAGINGPSPRDGVRGWARGYGFYESVDAQSLAQGDYTAQMGGAMAGADWVLDGGLLLGGFVGFTPGEVEIAGTFSSTTVQMKGVNFGLYGSYVPEVGNWYAQGYAMGGYNFAEQDRSISIPGVVRTASSSVNVWGAMVGGEAGLNLKAGERSVLQPYLSLDYGYYTRGGYSETGAASLNLTVSSQDANLLQPAVGARFLHTIEIGKDRLTPFIGGAFVAQVALGGWSESATSVFDAGNVYTYGEGVDDLYGGSFEAGLEFSAASGWTAYASFNGMALTRTQTWGGQIGINIPF